MIYFFAGALRPSYFPHIDERLESYYEYQKTEPTIKRFRRYLLDSGGFVARTRGIEIDVTQYAEFINKHKVPVAFNLDTNDVQETLNNQKYLDNACPQSIIIPVYHASDYVGNSRELIDDYCRDYKYIAMGGYAFVSRTQEQSDEFMKHVFRRTTDKIKVHGLGMSGTRLPKIFPYFSVDSTTWKSPARFANGRAYTEIKGYKKYAKAMHYDSRLIMEIKIFRRLEQEFTSLWEKRGVHWKDDIWGINESKK